MPKYKCTNITCTKYDEIEVVHGTRISVVDGEVIDRNAYCKVCGDKREVVREPGITTMIAGTNDQRLRMERG